MEKLAGAIRNGVKREIYTQMYRFPAVDVYDDGEYELAEGREDERAEEERDPKSLRLSEDFSE